MQSALGTILTFVVVTCILVFPDRAAAERGSPQSRSFVAESPGFCPNGFYYRDPSDLQKAPHNTELWGSYCGDENKDQNTGYLKTTTFAAPAKLQLYLAGYPSRPGLLLELENQRDGSTLPIKISNLPHEAWGLYQFSVPSSWQGKPVRLVAEDRATTPGGWFALSRPEPGRAWARSTQAMSVVKPLILSLLLIGFIFYAGCFFAAQLGARSVVLMGLSGLAAVGLDGYLAFWLWFFSPSAGRWSDLWVPGLAAVFIVQSFRTLDSQRRQALKELSIPFGLVAATSLLVVSTGFLYGGFDDPFETASIRFSHPLPPDNTIPYLFAEGLVNGHVRRPLLADWLSSDRPPLQTGLYLTQRRYFVHELPYTVVSIVVQSLWILALWLVLKAFRIRRRATGLILLVCLFNGFIFLNNFYTWPKLLAASYVLGFAALLLPKEFYLLCRDRWPFAAVAGAMFALGMLSHGGSMFGIAGVLMACLLLRRSADFKLFSLILLFAALLYLPWTLYQKFYEPPGDRLLKYHLAGVEEIDPHSFGQVVAQSYSRLTVHDWIGGRVDNLLTIVDHQSEYWRDLFSLLAGLAHSDAHAKSAVATNAAALRALNFFYLFPCMGPLLAGFVALAIGLTRKTGGAEWRAAVGLWVSIAGTMLVWCLLMFKPGTTIIHQGSYALVLIFVAASMLTLWALSPLAALLIGALSAGLQVLLYVALMRRSISGEVLNEDSLDRGLLAFAILALAAVALLLWRLPQGETEGCRTERGELTKAVV